ncbi:MAG TPA: S9 family peptidase [Acidimicrobiales bacterium]|nr:S9 family peptidase [Acidimicrobiales bacterium]
MRVDVRTTALWRDIESHFDQALSPGFGRVTAACELTASPDGQVIAFTGSVIESLGTAPRRCVALAHLDSGVVERISWDGGESRLPRWSPDGSRLAFVSDRRERECFQLQVLDRTRLGEAVPLGAVDGTVEDLSWSPDGARILLLVADRGADVAGAQGSSKAALPNARRPSWMPSVSCRETDAWRRLWSVDVASGAVVRVSPEALNVWEATWCGSDHVVAVTSRGPDEGSWYSAELTRIGTATGEATTLYAGDVQIGQPACNPSGTRVAVVEAPASDRGGVAGTVVVVDVAQSTVEVAPVDLDASQVLWRDDDNLLVVGLRGLQAVATGWNTATGRSLDEWTSDEALTAGFPTVTLLPGQRFASVLESWDRYPEIAVFDEGRATAVACLGHAGTTWVREQVGPLEPATWKAPDGLTVEGLVCSPPHGDRPFPLVTVLHGGPIWAWTNTWSASSPLVSLLVSRGYAVFLPNPRGSMGRGREFASLVVGDMGGADSDDILAGIDALVAGGFADPARLGVTGGSYGGFMTSWLVTRTKRFAAAVSVAPVTNWYTQHNQSNIGTFDRLFLDADPFVTSGRHFDRSPAMHAAGVTTPVLNIAGALDRCTPPGQAVEFHNVLREHGAETALVLYPEEGHGVRSMPAQLDFCVRVVSWFEAYMPPGNGAPPRSAPT